MLRTAKAQGTHGLVVEMADGTSEANAAFRRNVGFYYDLVKANVERIVTGLTGEIEELPVTPAGVTPGWMRRRAAPGVRDHTDGGKPDCWVPLAKYGWDHADGRGIDEFR
jgi:hypothetical protein